MKKRCVYTAFMALVFTGILTLTSCGSNAAANRSSWETVIPFEYNSAMIYPDGNYIQVSKDQKYGLYKKGDGFSYELLFSPEYEEITFSDDYIFLKKDNKFTIHSSSGVKLLEQSFTRIWGYSQSPEGFSVEVDGSWGLIAKNGEWIIPPQYGQLIPLDDVKQIFFIKESDARMDVMNVKGKSIIPSQMRVEKAENSYIYVTNEAYSAHGVLNYSGETIIPLEYKSIKYYPASKGIAAYFVCKDLKDNLSILDVTGKILLENLPYDFMEPTINEQFIVKQNENYGLIKLDGSMIAPVEYQSIYFVDTYGITNKNGEFFISDIDGNMTPVKTDIDAATILGYTSDSGILQVMKNDKYGYMNLNGELLVPASYEDGDRDIFNELILVKKDGQYGYIDKYNNTKIPFEFSSASNFRSGYALVEKDGHVGVIDLTGNEVVPFQFDPPQTANSRIPLSSDIPIFSITKNGKFGCILVHSENS